MKSQIASSYEDYLGYQLIRRASLLSDRFNRALRAHNLSSSQFSALAVIATGKVESNAHLAREIVMTPQSVGTLLEVLEKRGFIDRSKAGGQNFSFSLTDGGLLALSNAYEIVNQIDGEIRANLSENYDLVLGVLKKWVI